MPSSAEICAFFFEQGPNFRYTCKICNGGRKQGPSTGYSNLLSHLAAKHPDYLTEMATSRRAPNGTMESFGFVSETVDHLYRWMRWVVVRNLPLCEVDNVLGYVPPKTYDVQGTEGQDGLGGSQNWQRD
ncbi:hypothetical protein PHMEG_00032694 [Phytophthora megakarya]|uniref:BED-type domain-containing protein n=1 Tax=Phytophthora megakarya TaxID=4795 RepID=A0A225UWM7_9STRA|nr:hypothetical protein PHMEG_00032694 [Phytophthora megakarya]